MRCENLNACAVSGEWQGGIWRLLMPWGKASCGFCPWLLLGCEIAVRTVPRPAHIRFKLRDILHVGGSLVRWEGKVRRVSAVASWDAPPFRAVFFSMKFFGFENANPVGFKSGPRGGRCIVPSPTDFTGSFMPALIVAQRSRRQRCLPGLDSGHGACSAQA